MTSRERRTILWFSVGLIGCLLLTSPALYDSIRMGLIRRRARSLKVGDPKTKVESILGRPDEIWDFSLLVLRKSPILGITEHMEPEELDLIKENIGRMREVLPETPEEWSYGKRFDWKHSLRGEFPYVWPLRVRVFGPDPDDVMIEFDDDGNVSEIIVP